jgi:phage terminase small subunit
VSLTPKKEKFAQELASGKNPSDAYRAAYDTSRMQVETIRKRASELAKDGDITGRLGALRAPAAEAVGITLESHLRDLLALRNLAAKEKQLSAAISAEVARGKAAGVVIDRATVELTGKNGGPVQSVSLSPEQFRQIALEMASRV